MARELMRLGADSTIKDAYGLTPLERARRQHPDSCIPQKLEQIFAEGRGGSDAAPAQVPKKPAFFSMHSHAKIQPNQPRETPPLTGVAPAVGA